MLQTEQKLNCEIKFIAYLQNDEEQQRLSDLKLHLLIYWIGICLLKTPYVIVHFNSFLNLLFVVGLRQLCRVA